MVHFHKLFEIFKDIAITGITCHIFVCVQSLVHIFLVVLVNSVVNSKCTPFILIITKDVVAIIIRIGGRG